MVATADRMTLMRGHKILLIASLAVAMGLPDAANAQFSPRGLVGAVTRHFREMLGHLGHFPRFHHSHMAQESRVPAAQLQLGNVGMAARPTADEDVLGFTFWPGDYAGQVRAHGFDVIAAAIIGALAETRTYAGRYHGLLAQSDSNGTEACDQGADEQVTWPMSQIEQTEKLNDAQRAALGKLRTALAKSIKTIRASCGDVGPLPSLDRVKATLQELWAVRDAGIFVRAQLKAFYDLLNRYPEERLLRGSSQRKIRQGGKAADSGLARQYQACASPGMESWERMLKEIEEKVRPSRQQTASLEALRKTSADMAKLLTASCAKPIPADPLARLDAANDQLSNMSFAATSVELALNGFYAQLDDEQKAKFDLLGR